MCPVVTSTMCTKLEHIKVHDYSELINILNCDDLWKKLGQHLGYCEDDIERFSLYKAGAPAADILLKDWSKHSHSLKELLGSFKELEIAEGISVLKLYLPDETSSSSSDVQNTISTTRKKHPTPDKMETAKGLLLLGKQIPSTLKVEEWLTESTEEPTDIQVQQRANMKNLLLAARLDKLGFNLSQTRTEVPSDGNCLINAILDQMRYDKLYTLMNFNHIDLLRRVLSTLPTFLKTEQIDWPEKTKGTQKQWLKHMSMAKSQNCGALCCDIQILKLISHFLNRHIIIYPLFPSPDDKFIIPPTQNTKREAINTIDSTFEPFYLFLYSDVPSTTQHYLSIRPRSEQTTFKIPPSPPPLTKAPPSTALFAAAAEKTKTINGKSRSIISKEAMHTIAKMTSMRPKLIDKSTITTTTTALKRQISNEIEEVSEFKKKLRRASGSAPPTLKKDFFWANWDFMDIMKASDSFDEKNIIGQGVFGEVYRGKIFHQEIAIKRVRKEKLYKVREGHPEECQEMFSTYLRDLEAFHKYPNKNILMLMAISYNSNLDSAGDLTKNDPCLIYEYMANGSVADRLALKNGKPALTWPQRANIAIGTAKGLNYLHSQTPCVVHGDIKSSNILLDCHFEPKIADFGITTCNFKNKICELDMDVKYKSIDTYCYGVILFEMVTGKQMTDDTKKLSTVQYSDALEKYVDKNVGPSEWSRVLFHFGKDCTRKTKRPTMDRILQAFDRIQFINKPLSDQLKKIVLWQT